MLYALFIIFRKFVAFFVGRISVWHCNSEKYLFVAREALGRLCSHNRGNTTSASLVDTFVLYLSALITYLFKENYGCDRLD